MGREQVSALQRRSGRGKGHAQVKADKLAGHRTTTFFFAPANWSIARVLRGAIKDRLDAQGRAF
jgi:hypothetical protein